MRVRCHMGITSHGSNVLRAERGSMVGRERRAAAAAGVGRWPTPCCPTPQHRPSHSGRPTSADPRRAHPARRRPPQPTGRGAPRRRRADHHLPRGAAGLRPARGHRGRDPGPPGGDRRGRDRLGKDHPDPQDPARARAGPGRPDRAHPAPADRRGAISAELFVDPFGSIVGYQVRFTDQSSEQTLVKVMTDGILLAQIQRDPRLLAYDTLIIDEAHERSLNIDFILGYLTRLLPQRPDLKVVITSATIDSERFARHFGGPPTADAPDGVPAPVVEVTGRTYPVEVRYQPLVADSEDPGAGPADPDDPSTAEWSVPATTRGRVVAGTLHSAVEGSWETGSAAAGTRSERACRGPRRDDRHLRGGRRAVRGGARRHPGVPLRPA